LQTRLQQELEKDDSAGCNSSPFFVYSRRQILSNVEAYNSALSATNIPYLIGYSIKVPIRGVDWVDFSQKKTGFVGT